ncbi:MAG TPA: polysaccharide deacetylase family protein [Gemmataceae bacterium]|jgi:peptidoglycan/xylan/chitin deacetylase (PgdA/CDA1 family)
MSEETSSGVLAVLGYHKIGPPPPGGWETWSYVPEETFAGHLRFLRATGWQVLDLAAFLRGLAAPQTLPPRAVLLTFDDGYRSNLTVAVPWLRRFGFPAVLFVPTDFLGRHNSFDADVEPEEEICTWAELRELERAGVAVQSHGCSHRTLSDLPPREWEREIVRSRAVLEEGLGRPVEVFCYPYGDGGQDPKEVRRVLRAAGYRAACLYGGGPSLIPPADPYRLPRLAMGPDTDLRALLGAFSPDAEA